MAWKEGLRYGGDEARRIYAAAFPHAPLDPDKNFRITFEVEVNDCCEKCQGQKLYIQQGMIEIGGDNSCHDAFIDLGIPKFCPRCGRKLEGK
ncbi:MAG: hypothetical protein WC565_07170 [Parcubacteria group bacterium]